MERKTIRIVIILTLLVLILVTTGWIGFMLIENMPSSMAIATTINILSSVGLGSNPAQTPNGWVLIGFLQIGSIAIVAVAVGTLSQVIISGTLKQYLGRFRMDERINKLSGHSIVVGYSLTGMSLIRDLIAENQVFVVIEKDPEVITKLEEKGFLYVEGNALDETVLKNAGIDHARALFAVLSNDSDNLMVVLSARGLNPNIIIVSKSTRDEYLPRFLRAGANAAISPQEWASRRMIQAVLRPRLLELLSLLLDPAISAAYLDEMVVPRNSPAVGKSIGDLRLRQVSNIFILGIIRETGECITSPGAEQIIQEGDVLIGFGQRDNFKTLETLLRGDHKGF